MRRTIVVDAGCDLSEADRKALGIELWPIEIIRVSGNFLDQRDEQQLMQFYARDESFADANTRPMELYQSRARLLDFCNLYDEVLYLSVLTSRSPALQKAKAAADSLPISINTERKVRQLPLFRFVGLDSTQVFAGYAWLGAYAAIRLRANSAQLNALELTGNDIKAALKNVTSYLIPGQLKTIRERAAAKGEKSVGWLGYAISTALDIKPIIACREGKTGVVARPRGTDSARKELIAAIINQVESGTLVHKLITLVYGGDLSALNHMVDINLLGQACRKHGITLLKSMMSVTGLVNVGLGGISISISTEKPAIGDFSELL